MGTPPDREGQGEGWQPSGWQSQWHQPTGDQPWQTPAEETGGARHGNWQQAPDGSWHQLPGAQQSSGKSTAALVLGILGLVLCPLICSVLALVFGYQARREIDGSGGRLTGRGNATAGIVLGWIGVAIVVAFIGLVILGLAVGDDTSDGVSDETTIFLGHYL
jgi:uncharacterized protein DUF4190